MYLRVGKVEMDIMDSYNFSMCLRVGKVEMDLSG